MIEQVIEPLNNDDITHLEKQRDWLYGHFDNPDAYSELSSKLHLIKTVLENKWVTKDETWKLHSLGVAFGDALEQEIEELSWVAVEDDCGRDPALRWLLTSVLVFPITAISKRIEDGKEVDIFEMFGGFQKAINHALEEQT